MIYEATTAVTPPYDIMAASTTTPSELSTRFVVASDGTTWVRDADSTLDLASISDSDMIRVGRAMVPRLKEDIIAVQASPLDPSTLHDWQTVDSIQGAEEAFTLTMDTGEEDRSVLASRVRNDVQTFRKQAITLCTLEPHRRIPISPTFPGEFILECVSEWGIDVGKRVLSMIDGVEDPLTEKQREVRDELDDAFRCAWEFKRSLMEDQMSDPERVSMAALRDERVDEIMLATAEGGRIFSDLGHV